MGDINYFSGIVKILENPIKISLNDKISVMKFRVEIPQKRKNKILTLVFWGTLVNEVKLYYQINDYILIEGSISLQNKKNQKLEAKNSKQVIVNVSKVYPFLLKSNQVSL